MRTKLCFLCSIFVLFGLTSALVAQGPPASAPTPVPAERTIQVDCDAGDTLAEALAQRADELIVEFSGSCEENLILRRDRTRLVGVAAGAEIVGSPGFPTPADPFLGVVTVRGASNVTLADFTVRGGRRGVSVLDGGFARLEGLTVRDNSGGGVFVQGSRAWIDGLAVEDNGGDGLSAWDAASVIVGRAAPTVIRRSGRAGILASGDSDVSGLVATQVESDDNLFGLVLQLGASSQSLGLSASGNDFGAFVLSEASLGDAVDLRDNQGFGMIVSQGGNVELRGRIEDNGTFGVLADTDAVVVSRGLAISGHAFGLWLDGTQAFLSNTTASDPANLLFGTRVDFAGGNSFPGGVSCDETVLVRGDVGCPSSLDSLRMGGVAQAHEPTRIEMPGPLPLEP